MNNQDILAKALLDIISGAPLSIPTPRGEEASYGNSTDVYYDGWSDGEEYTAFVDAEIARKALDAVGIKYN
jgi:hypothetical protein